MKKSRYVLIVPVLILLVVTIGCSSGPTTVETLGSGQTSISLNAGSNFFNPNVLQVGQTGPLTLEVTNTSDSEHNITVENPAGQVIGSRDLPPGQRTTLRVDLNQPGTYSFYCNKLMHAQLGMRGTISVAR